jgi:hypothetical protein
MGAAGQAYCRAGCFPTSAGLCDAAPPLAVEAGDSAVPRFEHEHTGIGGSTIPVKTDTQAGANAHSSAPEPNPDARQDCWGRRWPGKLVLEEAASITLIGAAGDAETGYYLGLRAADIGG